MAKPTHSPDGKATMQTPQCTMIIILCMAFVLGAHYPAVSVLILRLPPPASGSDDLFPLKREESFNEN